MGWFERGFTLLVVMVFLVVLGLLGFTVTQSALTQEKISGNFQEKNLSFLAAEAALREAEIYLGTIDTISVSSGVVLTRAASTTLQGLASGPVYTISCANGCAPDAGGNVYYQVTATGWGARLSSVSRLESTFSVSE